VRHLVTFFSLVSFLLCVADVCSAQPAGGPLRPGSLIASPEEYLGKTVEVEIVEPLDGASTAAALRASEYGQVDVMIPDAGGLELALVPAAFNLTDPNRFRNKFDRAMQPPLRVKGEFLTDPEMSAVRHRPYYIIRVTSWEPATLEAPLPVKSLAEIIADPAKWDRKRIMYEGTYQSGFEVSTIDKVIWLQFQSNTEVLAKPADSLQAHRVRVTGILFAKPGPPHYGHLGMYSYQIAASKVEFLAVAQEH
jgi:hypothetical protein